MGTDIINKAALVACAFAALPFAGHAATILFEGDAQLGTNSIDFGTFSGGAPYAAPPGTGVVQVESANGVFSTDGVAAGELGAIQSLSVGTGTFALPSAFMTFGTGGSNLQLWATDVPVGSGGPFVVSNTTGGVDVAFDVNGYIVDTKTDSKIDNLSGVFTMFFSGLTASDWSANLSAAESFSANIETTPLTSGVPEPSAWGLMIAGIGLVGLSLRHWRSRQTVAA